METQKSSLALLTVEECRAILDYGKTKMYGLLRANRIAHFKDDGGAYRIPYSALQDYLDSIRE